MEMGMQVSELRTAILRLGALSDRHGATDEARALRELGRVMAAYSDKSVTELIKLAKPKSQAKPRARSRRQ